VARLIVLASRDLADGFRLAGAPTLGIGADDVTAILAGLVAQPTVGIILVTSDLWAGLEERTRTAIERRGRPLVVPVPVGELVEAGGRRAAIEEMLQRAIGFRMDLTGAASRDAVVSGRVP
jgi:vacuolar-type H+-ATPase subunit F/Vma7